MKHKKTNVGPAQTPISNPTRLEKCSHFWVLQNSAGEYFLEKVLEEPKEIPLPFLLMKRLSNFFHCNNHTHRQSRERIPLGTTTLSSIEEFIYQLEEEYVPKEGDSCLGIISASRIAKVIGVTRKNFFVSGYKKIAK